jgi:hypothetical protein
VMGLVALTMVGLFSRLCSCSVMVLAEPPDSLVVNARVVDELLLRRIVMPLPWPPKKRHGEACLP